MDDLKVPCTSATFLRATVSKVTWLPAVVAINIYRGSAHTRDYC